MNHKTALAVALGTLLAASVYVPATLAQSGSGHGGDSAQPNTRAARRAKSGAAAEQPAPLFPKATRVEPKQVAAKALAKQLTQLFDLQQEDKNDEVIAGAEKILANPAAGAFDKATASYFAGYAWLGKDTESYGNAITHLTRAIDENGLSNNTHYQIMLQVAQMQMNSEKYADAAITAQRFLAETQSEDPRAHIVLGNAYYRLEKYPESIAAVKKALAAKPEQNENLLRLLVANYMEIDQPLEAAKLFEELLVSSPNDKVLLQNLASVYQQADQDAKAAEVLGRMRAAGLMTTAKDYEVAYRLLAIIAGREKDALALIEEGLQKGILTPSYDVYAYIGNIHYNTDQLPQAIEAWGKAAPLAKDGEMYLNLAKLQSMEAMWAASKASIQQALARGVKKQGDAYMTLARAEQGLGNKPAVLAAFREAAKYPETREQANKALKQAAGK